MNADTHTPGPWHVDFAMGIITEEGVPIAYVNAVSGETPTPDAMLIASAPALLDALKECDDAFAKFDPDKDSRYGMAWAKVEQAIAKAEGRMP